MVCKGISIFLIFAPKHRLLVLVRTSLAGAVLTSTHNLYFGAKIRKISAENFLFLQLKKILYITWACFRNGVCSSILYLAIAVLGRILQCLLSTLYLVIDV